MTNLQFLTLFKKKNEQKQKVRRKKTTPLKSELQKRRMPPELKQLDGSIPRENLVEVGIICYRDPNTGEFTGKTKPIFQELTPEMQKRKEAFENAVVDEVSDMMLDFMEMQVAVDGYTTL